jgi:cytoskeletal protein CcmA (bactofilin family)
MTKLWLAGTALTTALMTSGCVIVVADEGDGDAKMWHQHRASDGYIVLDRDGDYSRLSGDLNLRGRIGGDLSLVSGDVDADGLDVGGEVSIAAGDVNYKGRVAGEVSIAGGDVNWDGEAGDEFSIASGDLTVRGRIAGEASLAAGDMDLDATFMDGLTVRAGSLTLDGEVSGPLQLVAINEMRRNRDYDDGEGGIEIGARIHDGGQVCGIHVTIASSARIDGRLEVFAEQEPEVERGARVDDLVYTPRNRRDCEDLIDD